MVYCYRSPCPFESSPWSILEGSTLFLVVPWSPYMSRRGHHEVNLNPVFMKGQLLLPTSNTRATTRVERALEHYHVAYATIQLSNYITNTKLRQRSRENFKRIHLGVELHGLHLGTLIHYERKTLLFSLPTVRFTY